MNDEAGAAAGGGSPAVLVVEDDGATGLLLREWLSAAGHRCLVAATAEAGWRVLREEESVWLVLVDVKMPGTYDGIDLLDCIAQMAHGRFVVAPRARPKCPVSGVSHFSSSLSPRRQSSSSGCDDVLQRVQHCLCRCSRV